MMFTRLPHTCSMIELSSPNLDKYSTKKTFLWDFDKWLEREQRSPRSRKRYSILYNCTSNIQKKHLKRIGFKEIGYYNGDSHVTILLMEINKVSKMTFWEWFNS